MPAEVTLSAQPDLAVHVSQTILPERASAVPAEQGHGSEMLFDMGQNMVGLVKLRVRGARGTTIRLRFAERLKPDGSIYTENLRNADATDEYTLRGDEQPAGCALDAFFQLECAAEQYVCAGAVGTAGKLPFSPHGLPAARRAHGLDGRRWRVLADRLL